MQSWFESIQICEKLTLYINVKLEFCFENYVDHNYNSHFVSQSYIVLL